nr:unnamed protein product [Callosobruchus chinensis]
MEAFGQRVTWKTVLKLWQRLLEGPSTGRRSPTFKQVLDNFEGPPYNRFFHHFNNFLSMSYSPTSKSDKSTPPMWALYSCDS